MLTEQPKATEIPKDKEGLKTDATESQATPQAAILAATDVPSVTITDHDDQVSSIHYHFFLSCNVFCFFRCLVGMESRLNSITFHRYLFL